VKLEESDPNPFDLSGIFLQV